MYSVKNNSKYELVIKNSKFITLIYKINDINSINNILDNVRKLYPDATHYCYAYIIDDIKKTSDDGEPSGTAGVPILKVLENNQLTNILLIVVRYFGGIKLGANGLIRAYSKCSANAIKENILCELVDGYNVNITFNYNEVKKIDYLLRDIEINKKEYNDLITYNIDIPCNFLDVIKDNNIDYSINKDIKIERD